MDQLTVMKCTLFLMSFLVGLSVVAQKQFITIDSCKLWINVIGIENRKVGQPVVIFENGHGTPMDNWDRIVENVAELAPAITYDRPGIGQSSPINEVPTLKNVADRLLRMLRHLELEPPYLLVGHSLGGVYVRGFAIYYPEMLAGLIIIDPADFTETHQNKRAYYDVLDWEGTRVDSLINAFIEKRNDRHAKAPAPIRMSGQYLEKIRKEEFKEIKQSDLPNIPVHIITGGRFDMPERLRSKDYDDEALFRSKLKHRIARWTEVVQSVDKGMLFYSGDAGHYVHWDDPDLVLSSIKIALSDYALLRQKWED